MSSCKQLKGQWDKVKAFLEIDDIAFISLRIIILFGGLGWLIFSRLTQSAFVQLVYLFISFVVYSVIIYFWLFITPDRKRIIYGCSVLFDFLFTLMLVSATGGFESPFINGFFLVTAIYSFHYGLTAGFIIAVTASALYLASGYFSIHAHYWPDLSVNIAFLFLLSVPLGILSQKLRKDKDTISSLNNDLHRYIEELQKVHGRLVQIEKLSSLGRLAADIAHEIRNPLISIGGFARRLDKKIMQTANMKECADIIIKEKEYAEVIISEVSRLERILTDVLTFSREVKSKMAYQGINEIISESLHIFRDLCQEHSIIIQENLDGSLPDILIDKDQVRLAINNLISNAIDAMREGGMLKINTLLKEMNFVHYLAIRIADTGHGIPEDKLNMIFEPFYSSKEIGAGTGLGLPLCKKIVDEHNGLLIVESELGKGTSFEILFPYQNGDGENKMKCWEFTQCGVEKIEGSAVMRCPSYPNYGRICWAVAGTFCGKNVCGAIAQKLGDCKKCEFYHRVAELRDL